MRNLVPKLVAAVWLAGATAYAGSFTSNFNNPNQTGYTLNGSGTLADGTPWAAAIGNNSCILTTNSGSLYGSFILDDLDAGQPIQSFTATFKLQFGPGTSTPADGMAFYFGPELNPFSTFSEEGPGGASGLTIEFDTYLNSAAENIGVDVKVAGTEIATHPMANTDMVTSKMEDVFIQLNRNGTLNLAYKGQVVYTNLVLSGWSPMNGIFGFGARTGGANEVCVLSNLVLTTTVAGAPVAPTIVAQPQSQTINELSNVTFSVSFDGTPPFAFQWTKNGAAIQDATNNILSLTQVAATDNNTSFKCAVSNGLGSVTSQAAVLTVKSDLVAPSMVSAAGSVDFTHATVVYSKVVAKASAETVANYQISGLTVSAAALASDNRTVLLTTSKQAENTSYTITVNNVKDTATVPNTIAANSKISFTSLVLSIAGAGALPSSSGNTFDVGVTFTVPVDATTAANPANYAFSAGTISGVTYYNSSPGVVIKATGLAVGGNYTVTVSGVADVVGNKMASSSKPFTISKMKWGVVGADEQQAGNAVVAVSANGFDVYSDGVTEWANYDETTFVYEPITGDFDKKLRIEYQDTSSQWARAGLIMREVTNFGVDRATQVGSALGSAPYDGKAGRYQKVHVNPVYCLPSSATAGTNGNNSWEGNRRLDTGGPTTTALTGSNSNPKYPNAWVRLQRKGQTFTIFRSDDGSNWISLGATTWPDSADPSSTQMPNTVYVGPEYSPENGNIFDTTLRGMWLAKFRDYGDTFPPTPIKLSFSAAAGKLTISWTPSGGTLQTSPSLSGTPTWTDVGAANPASVTIGTANAFYRVKSP